MTNANEADLCAIFFNYYHFFMFLNLKHNVHITLVKSTRVQKC